MHAGINADMHSHVQSLSEDHICPPDVTVDKRVDISGAFFSVCRLCLDCTVASIACLFNRLRSRIPVEATPGSGDRKSAHRSFISVGVQKEMEE